MNGAPVRYSSFEDCRRPAMHRIGHLLDITLDGKPVKRCIRYDIEAGEIERLVIDRKGSAVRNPRKPDEWLTQIVKGRVAVAMRPEANG